MTKLRIKLARFLAGKDYAVIPIKPSEALLNSMAMREDHSFGAPSYFDSDEEILKARESKDFSVQFVAKQSLTITEKRARLTAMKQIHEEVVGRGFFDYE